MMDTKPAVAIVERYIEGTRTQDIAQLQSIFHPNALMSGWLGPDMLVGSVQPFLDHLAANEVDDGYSAEITEAWLDGPIATVELRETGLFGMGFVNRFQLLRQPDDTWLIVAKLFRHG